MKNWVSVFAFILFSNISIAQVKHGDTCKSNCNFYSGILTEYALDSGTYIYANSNYHSYIEFTLPYFGRGNAKYRVEKLFNDETFIVTKTYLTNNKLSATCFLAVDFSIIEKIKTKKKALKYLEENRIYENVRSNESLIFYYISLYITKHNLGSNFLNFNPKSFVAWLKIKN